MKRWVRVVATLVVSALAVTYIVLKIDLGKTLDILGSASVPWVIASAVLTLVTVPLEEATVTQGVLRIAGPVGVKFPPRLPFDSTIQVAMAIENPREPWSVSPIGRSTRAPSASAFAHTASGSSHTT